MGIALFLVWKKRGNAFSGSKDWDVAMVLFFVQLLLNAIWTPIFFGLKSPGFAFAEIAVLWIAIIATLIAFSKVSKGAMLLMIPYFLWVSFAGYLNYSIWQLSKGPASATQTMTIPSNWLTAIDATSSVSFRYPKDFGTTFLHAFDWPPQIQILNQPYECTEGGSEIMQAGQTQKDTIGGKEYCVTKESEGAAGSIYTNYAYVFPFQNKTAIMSFTVRFVQCANYDEPSTTKCLDERATFNIDNIMGKVAQSLVKI
jgi:tryptophan-rich sensory protein